MNFGDFKVLRGLKTWFTPRHVILLERGFGILGILITLWMIMRLGPSRIASNLQRVGWGFFVLAAFKGVQYLLETVAWKLVAREGGLKIPFWFAFKIILEGNSLNYITLTRMGGEPLKAVAFRERMGLARSAASVIVIKFCVLLGFWIVICCGFIVALSLADLPRDIETRIGVGIALVTLFIFTVTWMQTVGFFRPLSWVLKKFESQQDWLWKQAFRISRLDEQVFETYKSRPWRITLSVVLCALIWIEELFFIWLALHFLRLDGSWLTAAILGTVALLLNHLFFFIPLRAGTQEGTMVLAFSLLKLSEPAGLSVAILKRLREILWVFVGLILFALETLKFPAASKDSPVP